MFDVLAALTALTRLGQFLGLAAQEPVGFEGGAEG
jgi:hypothetical protein